MKNEYVEYWEEAIPWRFAGENHAYEERRAMRYSLQDYMSGAIDFKGFRGKLVLEIGSGSGIDSAEFARNGAQVVSLDFTAIGTQGTTSLFKEAALVPNATRAGAQLLPFKEAAFECVYSFGVLHHIPNVEPVIKEIARVLKPEGTFVCMLYNKASLLYAYSILFAHHDEGIDEEHLVSRYSERILGCPYTKAYTKEEARALLSPHFDSIDIGVHYNVIDLPEKRKFKLNIPDRYELGWHLIVTAKRR